jgi:prepilin-type N-terminal cleavage/methylation domain-containing protein
LVRSGGSRERRAAFTLVEVALAIALLGVIMAIGLPRLNDSMRRTRVSRAAYVVASDLERAISTSGRLRRVVRVEYAASAREIRVINRVTGEPIFRRSLGPESEYRVESVAVSPPFVDIAPNGVASSLFTVTMTSAGTMRRVVMLRTGLVRVSQ